MIKIFIFLFVAPILHASEGLFYPFGIRNPRPPPIDSSIKIIDAQIGITASQVCGYTDWTTSQIKFPKEILSKMYWEKIANKIIQQAKQAVLSFAGALPSMLACNISPTFCHIMNHAELLANFELDFTMNSCEMMEGVGNLFASSHLSSCVKKKVASEGMAAGKAREACIINDLPTESLQKKNTSVVSQSDLRNTYNSFMDILFNESDKASYRITEIESFSREVLPGFSLSGALVTKRSGTFGKHLSIKADEITKKGSDLLVKIVKEMASKYYQGFSPKKIIESVEGHFVSRNEKENSPILRKRDDGKSLPTITPKHLFALVPFVDESGNMDDEALDIIDHYAKNGAYAKISDDLLATNSILTEKCQSDARLRDKVYAEHCQTSSESIKQKIEELNEKRKNDEYLFKAQKEAFEYIKMAKKQKEINNIEFIRPTDFKNSTQLKVITR